MVDTSANQLAFGMNYVAPRWLPGGNAQTIWPALYSRRALGPDPVYVRERWVTPDLDFIDVDWMQSTAFRPKILLVLFHGLEGSSRSHYAEAFADFAREHEMAFAVPHFRGCGGDLNLGPRAYHSGDFEEIAWILQRMRQRHEGTILVVGVSLGGNALLRWGEEMGEAAAKTVSAVAAVSAPIDLEAGGRAIGRGFNRLVYTRMFLKSMKPKAFKKLAQYPGLFNAEALAKARTLYDFDNVFTAPLHGFKDTEDYWKRGSAKPHLHLMRIPALVVNARNDPFVPASCLPHQNAVGPYVTLWQPSGGGHVGFPGGRVPGHVRSMPQAVGKWLLTHIDKSRP